MISLIPKGGLAIRREQYGFRGRVGPVRRLGQAARHYGRLFRQVKGKSQQFRHFSSVFLICSRRGAVTFAALG
jgi:hypothetical protein